MGNAHEVGAPVESRLTPAEIQALLRAGRSSVSIAEEAGADVEWIERWLPPIAAERDRVVAEAQSLHLERPRLGRSRRHLGESVATNLRAKGIDPEDVSWSARRRTDGTWTVTARFHYRGRSRTASWILDRDRGALDPASDLARDLGFVRD